MSKIFGRSAENRPEKEQPDQTHDILVATCALFMEMAHIDGEFSNSERQKIFGILKEEYALSEEDAHQLAEISNKELKGSIDLWRFTNLINENYSDDEKMRIVELLWQIIYIDGKIDKHEDYLIHKLARLLRLTHNQLIDAKLRVLRRRPS